MASPSSASGESVSNSRTQADSEQARKRARDRKAQQAMRDRAKYSLQSLEQQVKILTQALEQEAKERVQLNTKIQQLETENGQLKLRNSPFRLGLLGEAAAIHESIKNTTSSILRSPNSLPPWKMLPIITSPTCTSDQILQAFLHSRQPLSMNSVIGATGRPLVYSKKPNLCSFLLRETRSTDETSNIVGDIIRSYSEINTLPRQVAAHYIMCLIVKWMLLQDEESFNALPEWLRPLPAQLTTPHAYWIDRIPWPITRAYLLNHPEIHFDDFAVAYSTNFDISWDYDPKYVLTNGDSEHPEDLTISPIFEEHVRKIKSWTVGEVFRKRFPGIYEAIDGFN